MSDEGMHERSRQGFADATEWARRNGFPAEWVVYAASTACSLRMFRGEGGVTKRMVEERMRMLYPAYDAGVQG